MPADAAAVVTSMLGALREAGGRVSAPVAVRKILDAIEDGEAFLAERKPSVPNPCSVCGGPIFGGSIRGTGDGSMRNGGSFAHEDCYWRREAAGAIERLATMARDLAEVRDQRTAAMANWRAQRDEIARLSAKLADEGVARTARTLARHWASKRIRELALARENAGVAITPNDLRFLAALVEQGPQDDVR